MSDRTETIAALAHLSSAQARTLGATPAVSFENTITTYAELDERATRVACALLHSRVAPRQRVAILARNCVEFYELLFGAAKARDCLTPINFRLSEPEIAYVLGDCEARLLFVSEEFLPAALRIAAELPQSPQVIPLEALPRGQLSYAAWRDEAANCNLEFQPDPGDDVLMLYTSGTTGRPKGVCLTNGNYQAFLRMRTQVAGLDYRCGETVLVVLPLYHVAGVNFSLSAFAGAGRVILARAFEPGSLLRLIQRERVNHLFLAPSMVEALLQHPDADASDFSSLKTLAYGAAPMAEPVLARAQQAIGCDLVQFYGMTESTGAGTYLAPGDHAKGAKLRSCGKPWPGVEVRVVDRRGRPLAAGEVGEIAMRGNHLMKEYWRQQDATAQAIPDGWLRTGDAGYFDDDGYLYVHDRIKDLIITGGENVYPAEVENALAGCPGVREVAVIGVPSERWGEEVKAIVVAEATQPPAAEAIIAWARARIATYKAPKSIDFVSELPRNAAGKVLRRELRLRYWQGRERKIG